MDRNYTTVRGGGKEQRAGACNIPVPALLMACLLIRGAVFGQEARPKPPGPYLRQVEKKDLAATAFSRERPLVGTYYFYWYDSVTGEHFIDGDGTDALTDHPVNPGGYSYRSADWHERELADILAAGIDFILPVYWGCPSDHGSWSFTGIPPLVEAARRIESRKGKGAAPRIGLFYDTSTLRFNRKRYHADLTTPGGKEWLYVSARDFFSLVPPDLWATMEGKPILWLYSAGFARKQDPSALDYLRGEIRKDFGVEPYLVKEISWQGRADASYAWGAALRPTVLGVAAVGPGYDHSAVPGRSPLVKDREGGAFYCRSWEWVLSMPADRRPKIAVVETWNELHEGTEIAPTREYGRQYVDLTRKYAGLWKAGKVLKRKGPFAGATEVGATLGERDEGHGLRQSEAEDGATRPRKLDGKWGRETVKKPRLGGRYMYFDVDDSFYYGDLALLEIEVEYHGRSGSPPLLEYDSADREALHQGSFKRVAAQSTGSAGGAWRTAVFRIDDALFTGRSNGHDFRLVPPGPEELLVRRVEVRRIK